VGSINGGLKDQGNEVNPMNVTAQKQIVPNKVLVTGVGLLGVAAIRPRAGAGTTASTTAGTNCTSSDSECPPAAPRN
jgi:NAD/NADP transhydrogenase alpha subunit